MGEGQIFEYAEIHDESDALRCPVEGYDAAEPEGIKLVGHEYILMPSGGERFVYGCVRGMRGSWPAGPRTATRCGS